MILIVCVFVCVYFAGVCVFNKPHITAQSGHATLVIQCYSHSRIDWSSQGRMDDTCYENL